jgi:Ni/Co efflux regulator RcnB
MKSLMSSAALCVLAGTLLASAPAFAAPHWHDHSDWNKGGYMAHADWDHGQHIDYRQYHLRKPPRGYEWRNVGGRYVLAAVATGLIADIVLNGH